MKRGLIKNDARIISVTGDIYIMAKEASPDFTYKGEGQMAYCRSKFALNWLFFDFHKKYPSFNMYLVHPGVVGTELAADSSTCFGLVGVFKSMMLLDDKAGA